MLLYHFSIFSSTLLGLVSLLALGISPPCSFILSYKHGIPHGDRLEQHYWYLLSTLLAQEIFPLFLFIPVCSPVNFENIPSLLAYSCLLFYSELESTDEIATPFILKGSFSQFRSKFNSKESRQKLKKWLLNFFCFETGKKKSTSKNVVIVCGRSEMQWLICIQLKWVH